MQKCDEWLIFPYVLVKLDMMDFCEGEIVMSKSFMFNIPSGVAKLKEFRGRELCIGDYVVCGFVHSFYSGKEEHRGLPLFQLTENGIVGLDLDKRTAIANVRPKDLHLYKSGVMDYCIVYKLEKHEAEELLSNLNYVELEGSKARSRELFQRDLCAGDLVLTSLDNTFKESMSYALVIGDNVFYNSQQELTDRFHLLIKNPTEEEMKIKQELIDAYQQVMMKDIKALDALADGQRVGDVFYFLGAYHVCINAITVGKRKEYDYLILHGSAFQYLKENGYTDRNILNCLVDFGFHKYIETGAAKKYKSYYGHVDIDIRSIEALKYLDDKLSNNRNTIKAVKEERGITTEEYAEELWNSDEVQSFYK